MATKTLSHHRKSENRYTFTFGRQTVTVTRRFLANRSVRVRVTSVTGKGDGNWSEYRDFTDMHEGDAAYGKQATRFCQLWEERYCSTPTTKKETTVTDEPTQEPTHPTTPEPDPDRQPSATQLAAGFTATPTRAAELATRRTGIQHVVSEDGRTLCRPATLDTDRQQDIPEMVTRRIGPDEVVQLTTEGRRLLEESGQQPGKHTVLPGERLGRGAFRTANLYGGAPDEETRVLLTDTTVGGVIAESRHRVPTDRPSRVGEMARLLHVTRVVVDEAKLAARGSSERPINRDPADQALHEEATLTLKMHTVYFDHLLKAGYGPESTWEELKVMLRPLVDLARNTLPDLIAARSVVKGDDQVATVDRVIRSAQLFLMATAWVRSFYEDSAE